MATYKVIQDIEAEDKFVGPLTIKQFVFAAIGLVFSYLCFIVISKDAWFISIFFAPVAFFGFFMAIPWSKDQPTDLWVLAKIRFRIKPKTRVWNQSGVQELVTITAPKKVEKHLTKDLTETEVESRLKILADTMNTRGWAVKHAAMPASSTGNSDRLLPTPVPIGARLAVDDGTPDIMETNTHVDALIDKSEKTHKANLQVKMDQARKGYASDQPTQSPKITPAEDSSLLSEELKKRKQASDLATVNMQKLQPKRVSGKSTAALAGQPQDKNLAKTEENQSTSTVTEPIRPDIISLAHNNDLDVATLARQASKDDSDPQEVVVSLH